MSRWKLLIIVLVSVLALAVQAQDTDAACRAYTDDLEKELSVLNIRLESFVQDADALRSDYAAWQGKRLDWQAITPPSCAVELHDDVIALYANLGDISAWGLWLESDPASISGNRQILEAIVRADASITATAHASAAISGNEADIAGVSDSLASIAERYKNS